MNKIYVFNGEESIFPSAVFSEFDLVINWIQKNKLTGILNVFPLNIGVYDWALENNYFEPKSDNQKNPKFIGKFSCANIEHYHFENGILD